MPDIGANPAAAVAIGPPPTPRLLAWLARRSLATRIALGFLALYLGAATLGDVLTPYSATAINMNVVLRPPSWAHVFGTDGLGRDVFSRVLVGTRTILGLSFAATVLGVSIGSLIGMASGYIGGRIDNLLMRFMDIVLALPGLLFALLILTSVGSSKVSLVVAIGAVFIPKSARVTRSAVLPLTGVGYVEAARLRGDAAIRILLTEILPNIREVVGVEFCLRFAYSMLLISSLGFLGFGVQPPTPDWGLMISDGRNFVTVAPWIVLFPALAIGFLVVAINVLADGLWRDRTRPIGGLA